MADQQGNTQTRKSQSPADLPGISGQAASLKSGNKATGGRNPREEDDADEDDDTE